LGYEQNLWDGKTRNVRGQEIVTTPDCPEGRDIIQDYGRKTGKFLTPVLLPENFFLPSPSPEATHH